MMLQYGTVFLKQGTVETIGNCVFEHYGTMMSQYGTNKAL